MLYRQLHKKTRQEQQSSSNTKQLEGLPSQPHCISELQPAPGLGAHGTPAPAVEHKLCAFPAQMNQSAQLTLEDLHSGSQPFTYNASSQFNPSNTLFRFTNTREQLALPLVLKGKVSFHASSMEHCLYSITDQHAASSNVTTMISLQPLEMGGKYRKESSCSQPISLTINKDEFPNGGRQVSQL